MTKISLAALAATASLSVLLAPDDARAAGSLPNAWVSGRGADRAGCGAVTAPCRTFQYVLDNVVAPNGSVLVFDPANYGPMRITFPVSILNKDGGTAGVFSVNASTGIAVEINLALPGVVILQGLTLAGSAGAGSGIYMTSPGTLAIEGCEIRGFTASGAGYGLILKNQAGAISFLVSDSVFSGNTYGVLVQPGGSASASGAVRRSVAYGNRVTGFLFSADSTVSGNVQATVEDSLSFRNAYGVSATSGSTSTRANVYAIRSNATANTSFDLFKSGAATMTLSQGAFYYTKSGF